MKDFYNIDEHIEENQKLAEFYYSNSQVNENKASRLIFIYSLFAVYLLQIVKYPFLHWNQAIEPTLIIYLAVLLLFLLFAGVSIYHTVQFLDPKLVAYRNSPQLFYKDLREQYEAELGTEDPKVINEYLKFSYLSQLETMVEVNSNLFAEKSRHYFKSFRFALVSLILYLICVGFVVFEPEKPQSISLENYQEIINSIESIEKDTITMADEDKKPQSSDSAKATSTDSGKVQVDPKKVIKVEPKLLREDFRDYEKSDSTKKNPPTDK